METKELLKKRGGVISNMEIRRAHQENEEQLRERTGPGDGEKETKKHKIDYKSNTDVQRIK